VNIPYEVVSTLGIKDGEEVDFFKYSDKYFLFAKKSDVVLKILGANENGEIKKEVKNEKKYTEKNLETDELKVLKKLDTIRYNNRTKEYVKTIMNGNELNILQGLIRKKAVSIYKKEGENDYKYGISKDVYDKYLFGKRNENIDEAIKEKNEKVNDEAKEKGWEIKLREKNKYADLLEVDGYLVLTNAADAEAASAQLEESIRHGLVVGTRAFNKKYYVAIKSFVTNNSQNILRLIEKKSMSVDEISAELHMDAEAVRTILYLLSESGDVTEMKKDIFRAA
jgi:bifunctional DNA-binding transcriptional regulator/antitoxin component of YhaV-PrlF toxin-antitoxin module